MQITSTQLTPDANSAQAVTIKGFSRGSGTPNCVLVEQIRRHHPPALEELYEMVKNFSFFLMRQLGREDLQDNIHDVFLTAAQAITAGKLRDPERLTAFLTTVTRFYSYSQIERRVQGRSRLVILDEIDVPDEKNLEQRFYSEQQTRLVNDLLQSLSWMNREILRRFYIEEQPKEQICRELKLTPTQFRNMKSQAKMALTKIGKRRLRSSGRTPAFCAA